MTVFKSLIVSDTSNQPFNFPISSKSTKCTIKMISTKHEQFEYRRVGEPFISPQSDSEPLTNRYCNNGLKCGE